MLTLTKITRGSFGLILIFAFGLPAALQSAPVDLSPPKNAVGSADGDGYLRYVHRFGDIVFSDNFSIPLRFDFSSRRIVEGEKSALGWHGWNCGAMEAVASVRADGFLEVQLLCAKIMHLLPVRDQAGAFISQDGNWKGTVEPGRISIEREDGWVLRFSEGKVESLRTDKGREIRWTRNERGQLLSIQEEGTEAPQLRISMREDGTAEEVATGPHVYQFHFKNGLLSGIEWTLESGAPRSIDLVQLENSLQIQTSKLNQFRFLWDAKSGLLLGDGENQYTLRERRLPGQTTGQRFLSMKGPDGSVVSHELGSRSPETRFISAEGKETVVTRIVSDDSTNGAVDRVEWIREGEPPFVLMKNAFDEEGRIIQRLWLGNAVTHTGYDRGAISPALLPDRETIYPVDQIDSEAALTRQQFTYTAIGQLERVTSNAEEVLQFEYDEADRLKTMRVANRFENSFLYGEDGSVVESLTLPDAKTGPFWYLETDSEGVGPDLVVSAKSDAEGRLLSQKFADGRSLTVEYDASKRRVGDRTIAADGQTEIEHITYVHSPQEMTALRIQENLLTGGVEYTDIGIHAIGTNLGGRKIPEEVALRRSSVPVRE